MGTDQTFHVFIDTNVFLSFFAYTGDDIEQLKQVTGAIKGGKLKLYLTRQVVDEFARNREKKIKESIKNFTVSVREVPRLMQDYPEGKEFVATAQKLDQLRNALSQHVQKDAEKKELAADKLFAAITEAAGVLELAPDVVAPARLRNARRNPPGKDDSLGDQLNWESLLSAVPEGNDLHIVSKDGDWASALAPSRPQAFLVDEWKERKGGDLHLHTEIKAFLAAWAPLIKLKLDKERAAAILLLETSPNFQSTHDAIQKLVTFVDVLTIDDVKKLADVAISNNQVGWIAGDADVADFYRKILPPALASLAPEMREKMVSMFGLEAENTA